MTTSRDRRVSKELADIRADQDNSGVFAYPLDGSSLKYLRGQFPAPPDTPYEGGTFEVDIEIPDTYPFKSPSMRFRTLIWHPNVSSQTGAICLDTLGSGWSPVQTIKTALLSLRMLLEFPNPRDPQDAQVAKMLLERPMEFAAKAHDWAVRYAGAPKRELNLSKLQNSNLAQKPISAEEETSRYLGYSPRLVGRFVNMGFEIEAIVSAFASAGMVPHQGEDVELDEANMSDITARLLGDV